MWKTFIIMFLLSKEITWVVDSTAEKWAYIIVFAFLLTMLWESLVYTAKGIIKDIRKYYRNK